MHALMVTAACGASRESSTVVQPLPTRSSITAGAPCDPAKTAYECTNDRTQLLVCDARRWRVAAKCLGTGHCVSSASKIKCDDTIAEVATPCASELDMACSIDGAALLQCKSGMMVETSRCRGAKACVVAEGVPTCDRTTAEVGDACDSESETACTVKGDAVVQCRNKTMVQTTVCNCRVSASGTTVRCAD